MILLTFHISAVPESDSLLVIYLFFILCLSYGSQDR